MARYILRRVVLSLLVIAGVVLLTFLITRLVPGDPALTWAGPRASADELERAREFLGLDRPLPSQIGQFFGNVASGDLGVSIRTRRPVLTDLREVVPASLGLVIPALLLAVGLGVPIGLIAARYRGRAADVLARVLAIFAVSAPVFWVALILQLLFFQVLGLLPAAGEYATSLVYSDPLRTVTGVAYLDAMATGNWPVFLSALQHIVLPAMALALWPMGVVARMVRASVLDASEEPFAQMVRSLGFSERAVLSRFVLRLAWSPVVQVLALVFAYTLANAFLVEAVFNWPGLGSYAALSITSLDVPAIIAVTLFVAVVYVVLNLIVDVVQAWLDPRVVVT